MGCSIHRSRSDELSTIFAEDGLRDKPCAHLNHACVSSASSEPGTLPLAQTAELHLRGTHKYMCKSVCIVLHQRIARARAVHQLPISNKFNLLARLV